MDFFAKANDDLFDTVFETTRSSESLGAHSTKPRWQRKQEAMLKSAQRPPLSPRPKTENTPKKEGKSASIARTTSKPSNGTASGDRFIASRNGMEMSHAQWQLSKAADAGTAAAQSMGTPEKAYAQTVADKLLGNEQGDSANARILGFKEKAPAAPAGYHDSIRVLYSKNRCDERSAEAKAKAAQPRRVVPTAAERVLDAPELRDDYYLNLLDWNNANVIGIALNNKAYLWDATTQAISELCTLEHGYISSIKWTSKGSKVVAIGTSDGSIQLWDVVKMKRLRNLTSHVANSRVGVLAWNQTILSSGGQDTQIVNSDVRLRDHVVSRYKGHTQEVCGLTWNADGDVLASGGNDNMVALWDARSTASTDGVFTPQFECREHISAVKALAWSPHQRNLLVSGGGTADKCIKMWNSINGQCLNTINTGSQVTQLAWNPDAKELLSAHGYAENQMTLWSYPRMSKIADLKGHSGRILSLAVSPATGMVCSAGADETLRFWNPFGGRSRSAKSAKPNRYYAPAGSRAQFKTRLSIR